MRLWTNFRHFPGSAALPWTFAVLVILAGCGKNSEPSVDGSPSDEATSDQSSAVEMPAPTEPQLGYPPVADHLEDAATATPQPEDSAAQPAFAPLPRTEDTEQMSPADQPAAPPLTLPEVPPPTEDAPVPVAPQAPDAPAQPLAPVMPVAPAPAAPAPAEMQPETPAQPTAEPAPESAQPDAAPSKQFHENPLREGTDDFPKNQSSLKPAPQPETVQPASPATAETSQTPIIKVSSKGKSEDKFDPVAENGRIFVGWEKPQLALLISGRQDGYLEPCGCAGLDRMKGGLTRRHSLFKELRADGWPLVAVDCGGLIKGFGRQAELKFHLSVDAMKEMGYDAIALGKSDLRLPGGELLSRVASSPTLPSMFVSANVAVLGFDVGMTTDHRIVEAGGYRVGITSVLGPLWQKDINNSEIEMADPKVNLREVLKKFEGKTDLLVLLAHATMEESKELAAAFPQFDIVVTAGGNPEPPQEMEILPGGAKLIEVGEKGMNAIVLGIYGKDKIKYQRVPLDSRFADSKTMKEYMRQYQQQLRRDGLVGLGIRQVPHPRAEELGKFVGSKKCKDCHDISYDVWKKSGHAKAWQTLKDIDVPRNHDPECISCHVIGWHPTEYFPYESGFLSEEETPEMINVGCEDCHGPGEKHVEAEMGSDTALQEKLQKAMVVTKEQAQSDKTRWCLNCHDLDNSPDFNFEEYWPKIKHSEDIWEDEK